ncbi:YceI family protein [Kiloniella antarctica]|uniref:YceI family protein n=1 Tax=Kiloniella antarctica TaxID=1550907 RepID=A0ABW5BEK9_9PROT
MSTIFRILLSAALLVFGIIFLGRSHANAAQVWALDAQQSQIGFVATQSGADVTGTFEKYNADIAFHPNALATSHIKIEIDTNSVNTHSDDRDKLIRSPAFFDTTNHPKAIFESSNLEKIQGDQFVAHGTLTMLGITKVLILPFSASVDNNNLTATGGTHISRLQYGIGSGQWLDTAVIGEDVRITFTVEGLVK